MDVTDAISTVETDTVLITNVSYETESRGHRVETPVIHIRGRRSNGEPHTLTVDGFRPYLAITQADFIDNAGNICNDRRVLGVEVDCSPSLWGDTIGIDESEYAEYAPEQVADHLATHAGAEVYHEPRPFESLEDEPLARLIARVPSDVGGSNSLRSTLEDDGIETFEADIPFERRFLISSDIYDAVTVPVNEDHVRYENWPGEAVLTGDIAERAVASRNTVTPAPTQQLTPSDAPDTVTPRTIVYDIEVTTDNGEFPDAVQARQPITAITAYDSYTDAYAFWGLAHDSWDASTDTVSDAVADELVDRDGFPTPQADDRPDIEQVACYESETTLLEDFHNWVLARDPDIFTGWNAGGQRGGFDTPYLIQRSYNVNARRIQDYSETGYPGVWAEDGRNGEQVINYTLQDRCTLDLLDAYKKTQYRELDSYRLDAVAEAELGVGKTGLDHDELDDAWAHNPVEFFVYNIRDTQATVGIERAAGLIDLFDNLRAVTGAQYETAINNGPMLDTLFLHRAHEHGLVLPTNTEPAESVYRGAKVFETVPGVHENCVYPDLSSLYPSLMAMLNLGTETIVGTDDDLAASEYTADDCFRFPVDERPFAQVRKGEQYSHIDRDEYKGVKTPDGELREMFDPQYDWLWVLKPEQRESFISDTIDELIDLKNQYTGGMYASVKRVTNSCYGVLGDSASGGVGFRLYDRQVAEGITMAGRLTIEHTAAAFTDYIKEHHDSDAQLIGGDTDSSVTSIPNAPTLEDAWEWSMDAVEYVDASYDAFVQDTFNFDPDDEHRLAVELESLASKLFFLGGDMQHTYTRSEDGTLVSTRQRESVRKRYAQHIVWDDDDGWLDTRDPDEGYDDALLDPDDRSALKTQQTVTYADYDTGGALADHDPLSNVGVKGFELVRSDTAQITKELQHDVLADLLLAKSPRDNIEPNIQSRLDDIKNGVVPVSKLARPKGVSQHLDDYGWKSRDDLHPDAVTPAVEQHGGKWVQKPGPTARGAKYADDHFDWEDFSSAGAKPRKVPIKTVQAGDYPAVYTYDSYPKKDRPDSLEVGTEVDALAVEYPERIPDEFVIDYDTIIEKEVRDPIEPIIETVGMDWDDIVNPGRQTGLDAFA